MADHTPLYTDTATVPATGARAIDADPINYAVDWRVVAETPTEITLTNLTADIDKPERVRIAVAEVSDIFKGTPYEAPADASLGARKGVSILIQATGGWYSSSIAANCPYSAHLVLKVPTGAGMDEADIDPVLARLLGHLFETKATTISTKVAALVRGALEPADM